MTGLKLENKWIILRSKIDLTNIDLHIYQNEYCKFRNLCVHLLLRITDERPEYKF